MNADLRVLELCKLVDNRWNVRRIGPPLPAERAARLVARINGRLRVAHAPDVLRSMERSDSYYTVDVTGGGMLRVVRP